MVAAGKKAAEGTKKEITVVKWLGEHGFCDVERNPKPTGCWDVKARKGKFNWVIEVKAGKKPNISLANFEKMIAMKGYTKIGLALVTREYVHLLEYPKYRWAAYKAWKTRKSQK
jgi:hypothetical protein